VGSKLWMIERDKTTSEALALGEQYTKEALQWMVDDGVATSVSVAASRVGMSAMRLDIQIVRPNVEDATAFTYYYNWKSQTARSG
jgi:phage gp46-like protein